MNICVVGNSKDLLDKELGKEIDSHEIVIRVNNFIIKGFEKSVGSKTTIVSCAFGSNFYPRLTQDTRDALSKSYIWLIQLGNERVLRIKECGIPLERVAVINSETYSFLSSTVYKDWWRKLPSSGIATIAMAIDLFPKSKISIVGFDKKIRKCHYYNDEVDEGLPTDGHDWKSEIAYIENLERSGKIKRLD